MSIFGVQLSVLQFVVVCVTAGLIVVTIISWIVTERPARYYGLFVCDNYVPPEKTRKKLKFLAFFTVFMTTLSFFYNDVATVLIKFFEN